ncbi:3-deoxy-D-manno-octulosonic acid transferase [Pseudozobellia thermophila]|uniref:3-deoxy-D-manno-octulosonic acid transferase n=1 Tax=Pseudozobellia thermophila TaxID=192903 RepID=A0A1M6KEN4_9FLAO|nr:glycosyltransferase N-terminal domain-containing protein [Pseudozobellia thermophila]SHJ57414.1 3-deoxy-D-manno-octulosonic-acid transferase [Pseudozobellia thermophila]
MHFIYNLIAKSSWFVLQIVALYNAKIKLFVRGRKESFGILENTLSNDDKTLWVHAASLGEYEQGLPIIEEVKANYPQYKIVVTFFSPSGYEVRKNTALADTVCYLPIDTKANARRFIKTVHPTLAIFVKYEVWPNYLRELQENHIPTLLISAIFREGQVYFKSYGGFMRKALKRFSHYFVQDERSEALLRSIGIGDITVSGDTRLDRVSKILDRDNALDFMEAFKNDKLCFVAGSTWPEDEAIIVDYINNTPKELKFVLAPHTIKKDRILGLAGALTKKTILYSGMDNDKLAQYDVLIIDHIGLLTRIYSYADLAYVGGAFATGLHNTLEPAVFGIPVIIGPDYKGFNEAEDLVRLKGIWPIADKWSFGELMKKFVQSQDFRHKTGAINANYVSKNKGASLKIMNRINEIL